MLCFVVVEVGVVGAEGFLVWQAEREAKRAEHVKEIIAKTNHLVQVCYDTGTSVMEYAKSKDESYAKRYKRYSDETREILIWLKEALKDDQENLAILNRVDANLQVGLTTMDKIKSNGL